MTRAISVEIPSKPHGNRHAKKKREEKSCKGLTRTGWVIHTYVSEAVGLTMYYLYRPDEDGAQGQSCDHGYTSCHYDHDVMIVPHTGWTAQHSTARERQICNTMK